MGTRQSRSGHGREGSRQHSQQTSQRPEQDRDLQRNKQSDRNQQQGGSGREQDQASGHRPGQQNVYGEGNYAATRQYDDATKQHVKSGRVEAAARAAAPNTQAEAREMKAAEAEGKRRARGEDPALQRRPAAGESSKATRPGHEEE